MSDNIDDGGSAFPHVRLKPDRADPCSSMTEVSSGMSLRDYFAAAALTGALSSRSDLIESRQYVVERSYDIADAMLKERVREYRNQ